MQASLAKGLKSIFKNEIHKSPKRLQRMRLTLQKYNLEVQCKKGTLVHIAYALSRVYLKTTDGVQTKFCEIHVLETVEIEEHIQIGCRIEMFSMNKLLQIVIFRNLSVLSS